MENERTYIKGFNSGYLLSQHNPELLGKLLKAENQNDYIKGMQDGKRQHEREIKLEKLNEAMKSKRKDKDRGMEI